MKKFISFALTAAMVASLVPATAFAKTQDGDIYHGTVSVVNAWNNNKKFDGDVNKDKVSGEDTPEAQIKITDVDYRGTNAEKIARFTVRLDNAKFYDSSELDTDAKKQAAIDELNKGITVRLSNNSDISAGAGTNELTYAPLSNTVLERILGDYYDHIEGGGSASGWTGALGNLVDSNVLVEEISAANIDAYTTPNASGIATGAVAAGGAVSVDKDWIKNVGSFPGSIIADPSYKTADQNRDAAWAIYAPAQTPALDPDDYGFGDLPAPVSAPGWYEKNDPGDMSKYITVKTVFDAAKAGKTGAYASVAAGIGDNGFIASGTAGNKTKAAWIADAKAKITAQLAADTTTAGGSAMGLYAETTKKVGANAGAGIARKGIVAKIDSIKDIRTNEITVTVYNELPDGNINANDFLEKGDIISIDLVSALVNASKDAGFSITSSDIRLTNDNADFTYVNVDKEAIQLSVRKVVDVAEDEIVSLDDKGVKIATNVGYFRTGDDNKITLKINGGFEFVPSSQNNNDWEIVAKSDGDNVTGGARVTDFTKEEIVVTVDDGTVNEITIYGIDIKAASAKIDKVATIKATAPGFTASSAVEVAKVVDYIVNLTVDEDEDVPVIYSGVNSDNYGITDDSDHWSLDVTAKESFPGAWSFRKGFNFELPDHVFVTDVEVVSTENLLLSDQPDGAADAATPVEEDQVFVAFFNAYQNGSHVNFEFDKRVFDDVDAKLTDDPAEMTFRLQLVADTGFEGDVPLKLTGELVEEQEVTIAKFVKPFEVKAEQNDIIIDYRYTDVPTAITITEAEAGLWDGDKATFKFKLEKTGDTFLAFEDATFEIDSKSGMSIKNDDVTDSRIVFTVDDESDDAAATVTMKNIQLFMNRSIPAGPYDLFIESSLQDAYLAEMLFAPDFVDGGITDEADYRNQVKSTAPKYDLTKEDSIVNHVDDVMDTVKEGFVNVVTAGRDVDDASFTTKVVVPVGENYIVAGEKQIELDTPAYINAAGYTMLPIRAVATALGINNQNVLWDQPTKTVTILYGQRIITMTQGQKVVYVNGSAIPASAAVENTNSRTFLPMRDLATALGVTDIQWDQATRTATLNGNQKGNQ